LFTIDYVAKPVPNAAQTLEDQQFEDPESQQQYRDCLTPVWHRDIHLLARPLEAYSKEAYLSTVLAAIQYSETLLQNQDDEVPDYEPSDLEDEYSRLHNLTDPPIILNNFFRVLPHCLIITGYLKCAMIIHYVFVHVQSILVHRGKIITSLVILIMNARWVS
jgi:hypothetical protein